MFYLCVYCVINLSTYFDCDRTLLGNNHESFHFGLKKTNGLNMCIDPGSGTIFSPNLYDVCIRADDGTQIQCHKCVLVARLEYFLSMLGSGWIVVRTKHYWLKHILLAH